MKWCSLMGLIFEKWTTWKNVQSLNLIWRIGDLVLQGKVKCSVTVWALPNTGKCMKLRWLSEWVYNMRIAQHDMRVPSRNKTCLFKNPPLKSLANHFQTKISAYVFFIITESTVGQQSLPSNCNSNGTITIAHQGSWSAQICYGIFGSRGN